MATRRNIPSGSQSSSTQPETSTVGIEKVAWERQLSLANCVSFLINCIMGTGIFVSPTGVLRQAGSVGLSLIIWVACGVVSAIAGLCYAELGTTVAESGGEFTYVRRAYGDWLGFLYIWIPPPFMTIVALTSANYFIQPFFPDCEVPQDASRLLAAAFIVLFTALNCFRVNVSTLISDVGACVKLVVLGGIVVAGVVHAANGHTETIRPGRVFEDSAWDVKRFFLAMYSGIWSYTGYYALCHVNEEIKAPERNIPLAITLSILVATIVYLLVNLAYFIVLPTDVMLNSDAISQTFTDRLVGHGWVISIIIALAALFSLNTATMVFSRMYVVAARHGLMPSFLRMLNTKYLSPVPSLILRGALSIAVLAVGDVYSLIIFQVSVNSIFDVFVAGSIFYFRRTLPRNDKAYRAPTVLVVLHLMISIAICVVPIVTSTRESLLGLAITLTGLPVYVVCVLWKRKPQAFNTSMKRVTQFIQKIFVCVEEEAEYE